MLWHSGMSVDYAVTIVAVSVMVNLDLTFALHSL